MMSRIIDLTLPLENGLRGISIEPVRTVAKDGWSTTTLHLYSHGGTHMDAPTHFGVTDETIDRIPVDKLIGPAWVADLSGVAPRALIGVDALGATAGRVRPGDGLLLRTDWSRRFREPAWRDELPRVSLELAQWCVERGVRILGVEPPSVADVSSRDELTRVHTALLGGGVIIVEGLANLDQIHAECVTFVALPLKVAGGDGAPVRALAIED